MQICAMHPCARDLPYTNPVLLWLLAARCVETAGWRERAAELLRLQQRAVLARILDRAAADVRPLQVRFLRKLVVIEGSQPVPHQVAEDYGQITGRQRPRNTLHTLHGVAAATGVAPRATLGEPVFTSLLVAVVAARAG